MAKFIRTAAVALLLLIPAPASAVTYLDKSEARGVAVDVLTESDFADAHPEADWYSTFWVEGARRCSRVSSRVVDCEFTIFGDDFASPDTGVLMYDYCDGTMRIRERISRYVWWDRPGECGTTPA